MPCLGRFKLKDITPVLLDRIFKEMQASGNLENFFRLKDKALCNGSLRKNLAKKAGIDQSLPYGLLRGGNCRKTTAEKLAAALGLPLPRAFDDVTVNKGLSGASTNKLKLNLSAIFTAAVKKEIMRRKPCKLVTPPKADTPPAAYLDEQQAKALLTAAHAQDDFQLEVIINLFLAFGLFIISMNFCKAWSVFISILLKNQIQTLTLLLT
jgi:hypothetical protein